MSLKVGTETKYMAFRGEYGDIWVREDYRQSERDSEKPSEKPGAKERIGLVSCSQQVPGGLCLLSQSCCPPAVPLASWLLTELSTNESYSVTHYGIDGQHSRIWSGFHKLIL